MHNVMMNIPSGSSLKLNSMRVNKICFVGRATSFFRVLVFLFDFALISVSMQGRRCCLMMALHCLSSFKNNVHKSLDDLDFLQLT